MHIHEIIQISGCITQERYIKGKTLPELERILGFRKGRLHNGIVVAVLIQMPTANQFELLGYSQVAEHRFDSGALDKLDVNKIKEIVLKEAFTLVGPKRLVKIIANTPHSDLLDNDTQYPPGLGVPQWKITRNSRVSARVVDIVLPEAVYR